MFDIRPDLVNDPENPGKKMKDYFKAAGKHLLANGAKLLEDMMNYDKDNISHHIIQQIEPFYNDPQFTPEIVEKASRACKAMCMWARAMYKYHQVTLTVGPKKILLRNAQVRTAFRMECITVYAAIYPIAYCIHPKITSNFILIAQTSNIILGITGRHLEPSQNSSGHTF